MEYQIKQLSFYAKSILQRLTTGKIHSVYRRTVNITDGTDILSLQTDLSPLSPISLISCLSADDMNLLCVTSGDRVLFAADSFEIQSASQSCRFIYKNARLYDLKLSKSLDPHKRPALISNIKNALFMTAAGGFSLIFNEKKAPAADLSLILLAAKNYIQRSNELYDHKHYQEAATELSRLLGLGIGLTPSGDDFLCGVLAGSRLTGSTNHPFVRFLETRINERLADTIDISAAFLSCALEGQYSLAVNQLYLLPAPEEILTIFQQIGHSSGMDTLCGVLWSLEHI